MGKAFDLLGILVVYATAATAFVAKWTHDLGPCAAVALVAMGVSLGVHLMAAAYCGRFGGRILDWASLGLGLAAVLCLPLLPWAFTSRWEGTEMSFQATLVGLVVLSSMLGAAFRQQGRYADTQRELPELHGERRERVDRVLEKAALAVSSVRLVTLGSFNAMVQGMGQCIILVDRRAADALEPDEFSALIAHEVGHVRSGGYLPYVAAVSWVLLASNSVAVLGFGDFTGNLFLVPMCFVAVVLVSQRQELRADAFAARLTSPSSVAAMLARIHGDLPLRLSRLVNSSLLSPFLTHPPLKVRRAALGLVDARPLRGHRWISSLTLTFFVLVPANIWIASHDGIAWADRLYFLTWGLPSLYLFLWLVTAATVVWAAKSALRATFGRSGKRSWLRLLTAITGMAVLVGFLLEPLLGGSGWLEWIILGLALAFLALLIVALMTRSLRSEFERLPKELRRSIRESIAALQEGHPREGLEILERAPLKKRREAWFLAQRAACYLYLDRLDDAARDLAEALSKGPRLLYPRLLLGGVELLRGNLDRAAKITEELTSHAPGDESAWRLRGLVALEAGKAGEAADMFATASRLKERNAPGLAGEVLAALEAGVAPEAVGAKLEEARRAERRDVTVMIAGARQKWLAGDREAASRELEQAFRVLSERGHYGFLRYYRAVAERWRLEDNPGPGGRGEAVGDDGPTSTG